MRLRLFLAIAVVPFNLDRNIGYPPFSVKSGITPPCRDGWPSSSIGVRGACSWHGGVDEPPVGLLLLINVVAAFATGQKTHTWLDRHAAHERARQRRENEQRRAEERERIKAAALRDDIACPKCGFPLQKRLARKGRHK